MFFACVSNQSPFLLKDKLLLHINVQSKVKSFSVISNSLQSVLMLSLAFFTSLYISISYVLGIYATNVDINDYRSGRDDPRIITQRMGRITIVTVLNILLVPSILYYFGSTNSLKDAFRQLGLWPHHNFYLLESFKSLLLIALLYLGPLIDSLLYYIFVPISNPLQDFKEELFNIWGFRNYIFAPITEEIFYTSMILNCYMFLPHEEVTQLKLVWLTPFFFGLAHLHHAYESYQNSRTTMATIILTTTIQITYTTIFGCLTNCVFLKTGGNLWACIILHAFCNFMGFPEPSQLSMYYTDVRKPPSALAAKLLVWWNRIYFILLILGIWIFKSNFNALLVSPYSLMQ